MVKDNETVIKYVPIFTELRKEVLTDNEREFNELVNMTPEELEEWLKSEESEGSGWTKEGGGETIGHERFVFTAENRRQDEEY